AETATISRDFIRHGFEKVDFREEADVYVINTCSVTHNADRECRKVIRRIRRRSPAASIAVVGCYAQLKPEEVRAIPGVNLVLGVQEKFDLLEHLNSLEGNEEVPVSGIRAREDFIPSYSLGERTRAFLKIQDGCDYTCSYCTIPLARGRSRSDSIANTLRTAKEIAATGVKEIVLTGVNIGDFGKARGESFYRLLQALDNLEGIKRIRTSSIEPNLLSDEIVRFIAQSSKFVPHFHMPLQSGSNKVLKAMRRRYQRELYADRVAFVKSLLPECCIGADVIVGFPGESEGDFMETYKFLSELDVSYLHVFTYSERDRTDAVRLGEKVPAGERSRRSKQLHLLGEKKRRFFQEQFLGRETEVLFEAVHEGFLQGHTGNYITVRAAGPAGMINEIVTVRLVRNEGAFMIGEIID
ncbi:MAG: tRNA (N(6)-L-threonylcarbamoyladenosine(37)-C(2))-methylthiotransferase MtaB, partial [FCB group bacterium]|nr:tRNA (N(6)-L-threonylcarbamoyladenosine(37)-C(2))-methylthiotransferase MtaB [FCB group bacterium]